MKLLASDWPERRWVGFAVFGYGTLAAALFAFVVYGRLGMIEGTIDVNCFGQIAKNIAEGQGFSLGDGLTIRRAPFYPYFGAVLLKLFGDLTPGLPQAVVYRPLLVMNTVLFGLTCVVVWRMAKELFDARTALLAAALCPLAPQSLRYVGMSEVETLTGLWTALIAATALALARRPSLRHAALFGLSVSLATLSKPVTLLLPFAFLPLAWFGWYRARVPHRVSMRAVAVALACFALPIVPWSMRNSALTGGRFSGVSSNGPGEFLRGYVNVDPKFVFLRQDFGGSNPNTTKWDPEANAFEDQILRRHGLVFRTLTRDASGKITFDPPYAAGENSALAEAEKDRVESAEVRERVLSHPGAFIRKFVLQMLTFWYIVETRTKSVFVGAIALGVLTLAGFGVVEARRRAALVWPVVFVILYFNAIYAVFLALARYSMPLYPTLMTLAAGGVVSLAHRFLPSLGQAASPDVSR